MPAVARKRYTLFTNKALFYLILPMVIEATLTMSLGLVDSFMVKDIGGLGTAMSAVSNVDSISNVMVQLFSAFGTGGAIITAQYLGAKKIDDANKSAKQLIVLMLVASLTVSALCLIFNHQIVNLIFRSEDPTYQNYCYIYFYFMAGSYPLLAVFYACAALLRAQRKSMNTMTSSAISFVLNIGLNALFIYVFRLEILGVALATFLARIFPPVFLLFLLTRKDNLVKIKVFEKFHFDAKMIGKIMKLAIPSGIESCLFQVGKLATQTFVANTFYEHAMLNAAGQPMYDSAGNLLYVNEHNVANGIVQHINTIGSTAGNGINNAMLTVIGQAVGTGDTDCVKYYMKKMFLISYFGNALCVALTWLLSTPLVGLFGTSVTTETMAICMTCLNVCFAVQLFTYPLSFGGPAVLKATSDVRYTMICAITSMAIMRVGLSFLLTTELLPLRLGALGVWIGMCADWGLRSLFFGGRILSGRWKKASGLLNDSH